MNREDRAKQFMPFDALKGLREELKKREEKYLKEPKKEIDEQKRIELSQRIAVLKKGDEVKIVFYYDGHYIELHGALQMVNVAYKYIKICDNKIAFDDLYDIEISSKID